MKKPVAPLAGMLMVLLTAPGLADTPTREDRTEVALRTLLTVVHQRIKPEEQHCNLGGIYVRSHNDANPPATVGEVLLSEMSTMVNGQNLVRGSCRGSGRMHCQVRLSHARGEDVSSSTLWFDAVDGKALIDMMRCISTP
jgi:hypothetical protein